MSETLAKFATQAARYQLRPVFPAQLFYRSFLIRREPGIREEFVPVQNQRVLKRSHQIMR